jgi:hypothetical protein
MFRFPSKTTTILPVLAACAALMAAATATAEVVRFEIERREPFADGKPFGDAGPYERIIGKVYYEIDPDLRQNEPIVDLQFAPQNERGRVEFVEDTPNYVLAYLCALDDPGLRIVILCDFPH